MTGLPIAIAVIAIAFIVRRLRRRVGTAPVARRRVSAPWLPNASSPIALAASREITQRVRSRTFWVATGVTLLAITAVIVIPALKSNGPARERVGIVGASSSAVAAAARASAKQVNATVEIVPEPDAQAASADISHGKVDIAVVDASQILVRHTLAESDGTTKAQLARALAVILGEQRAFAAAGLTSAQAVAIGHLRPIPIRGVSNRTSSSVEQGTAVVGLILLFVLLSQYGTWTLIGVMEEKASRVVEVLLAAIRPTQLLTGKVLGIGALVFTQAAILVGWALGLGSAVGSDILKGTAPTVLFAILGWLVLGYAFYSWVFAAAGSTVERQDQVQAIAFPITIPLLVGYVSSVAAVSSSHASLYVTVLAYIPLTSPFAMPVLVALHAVAWWQFLLSALISIAATLGMARLAGTVYRRAALRTGRRVGLREVLTTRAQPRSR
ncbi:MAG TPA: ABC transporter permease [Mycobacteriales bacterium]|nr:ABC transporter permease [Mycobacteriales bacterium]